MALENKEQVRLVGCYGFGLALVDTTTSADSVKSLLSLSLGLCGKVLCPAMPAVREALTLARI